MAKDLVSNMEVDEKTAKYKTIYQGKYYYFCAPWCKKTFEETHKITWMVAGPQDIAAVAVMTTADRCLIFLWSSLQVTSIGSCVI